MTTEEFRFEVPSPDDLGKAVTEAIQAQYTQAVIPLKAGSHDLAYLTIPLEYETREDGDTYVVAGGSDIAVLEPADEDTHNYQI